MKNDKKEYLANINKIKIIGDLKKDYIEGYEPISKKVVENAIQLYDILFNTYSFADGYLFEIYPAFGRSIQIVKDISIIGYKLYFEFEVYSDMIGIYFEFFDLLENKKYTEEKHFKSIDESCAYAKDKFLLFKDKLNYKYNIINISQ